MHVRQNREQLIITWLGVLICLQFFLFNSSSYAGTEECEVDNLEHGYWQRIALPSYDRCVLKGPPTDDSIYPVSGDFVASAVYIIQGKYKVLLVIGVEGYAASPPPAKEPCAVGYAEAYTKQSCDYLQKRADGFVLPDHISITYTASGTLCTHRREESGNVTYQYVRWYDRAYIFFEWKCDDSNAIPPNNYGSSCEF